MDSQWKCSRERKLLSASVFNGNLFWVHAATSTSAMQAAVDCLVRSSESRIPRAGKRQNIVGGKNKDPKKTNILLKADAEATRNFPRAVPRGAGGCEVSQQPGVMNTQCI